MFTLAGILLLMVGASLVFAVEREIEGVDLQLVGWIMMAGGLASLFVAIARFAAATNRGAEPTRRVERNQTDHDDDEGFPATPPGDRSTQHTGDHVDDHAASHGREHGRTRLERGRHDQGHDQGWAT